MGRNLCLACAILLAVTSVLRADACFIPFGGGSRREHMRMMANEVQRHNFAIERDPAATRVQLIVPKNMWHISAPSGDATPRTSLPMGIATACCVGVGGMWLARVPRRALVSGLLPFALAVLMTPARADIPRNVGEFRPRPQFEAVYVGDADVQVVEQGNHVRLILPSKAP